MKILYAIELNNVTYTCGKYTIYENKKNDDGSDHLFPLWPKNCHEDKPDLYPCMYSQDRDRSKPKFFFKVGSVGQNKLDYLAEELAKYYNESVEIRLLHGFYPSHHVYNLEIKK